MAVLGVIYNLQNPYLKMGGRIGRVAVKGGVVLGEEAGLGGRQYWEGRYWEGGSIGRDGIRREAVLGGTVLGGTTV